MTEQFQPPFKLAFPIGPFPNRFMWIFNVKGSEPANDKEFKK
jgi:hypothetical protein